jgi:hypothetical protein
MFDTTRKKKILKNKKGKLGSMFNGKKFSIARKSFVSIRPAVAYEMDEGRNLISKTKLDTENILAPVVMANVQRKNN